VALSLVRRSDGRTSTTPPSSRDGLRTLAAAWRATQEPAKVQPFARVGGPPPADAPPSDAAEPPYWPDGPSAA
jgi:hypothetical protein